MKLLTTKIAGVFVAETNLFTDHRGLFSRLFCKQELASAVGERQIVQVNQSCTKTLGAIRGMHFQNPPHAEMKLIRCLKGRVWDVAVDLRAGSQTMLQWHAEELSQQNARMLIIPEGCAHGFQVLEPDSELLYLHTAFYQPEFESGIMYNDPQLAISWPLPVEDLSAKDQKYPPIPTQYYGIKV
jgi:dTDP-4-dehydrorhamnose 3,5-epimerase